MTRLTLLVFAGALLLVAIVTLRRRREEMTMPPRAKDAAPPDGDDAIDWDALERAEREVRELDHDGAGGAPEQAEGEDWGPGTPKPPLG